VAPGISREQGRAHRGHEQDYRSCLGCVGFSQPIADNMEEAVSGVKGQLATKVYGEDLHVLEDKAEQISKVMGGVKGITDLGIFRVTGQPSDNLCGSRAGRALSNQRRGCPDAINTAAGGNALTQVLQGEARYDLVIAIFPSFAAPRSHRKHSLARANRRARFAGATLQSGRAGRGIGNLPGRKRAIFRSSIASAAATWAAP